MRVYRVFPWNPDAADTKIGGALFTSAGGDGRFDNPKLYNRLYCSLSPDGAVGERFGLLARWRRQTFSEGSLRLSLATLDVPDDRPLADLDCVDVLVAQHVHRVTEVNSRDRAVTQPLAARIFQQEAYHGIAWWSVYYPDWSNVMLWALSGITVVGTPEPLSIDHRAVVDAAARIKRPILA